MPVKDLTGQTIGIFTVLEFKGIGGTRYDTRTTALWLIHCARCGKESVREAFKILPQYKCCRFEDCKIQVRQEVMAGNQRRTVHGDSLKSNLGNRKHGDAYKRLYRIYGSIKRRCYQKTFPGYVDYGARGIVMCEEWLDKSTGYATFKKWALANGYTDNLTIDRINVNGNYEPGNCRWATWNQQANNKRNNVWVTFKGEDMTLMAALKKAKISHQAYHARLERGWTSIEALETPPFKRPERLGPGY